MMRRAPPFDSVRSVSLSLPSRARILAVMAVLDVRVSG